MKKEPTNIGLLVEELERSANEYRTYMMELDKIAKISYNKKREVCKMMGIAPKKYDDIMLSLDKIYNPLPH